MKTFYSILSLVIGCGVFLYGIVIFSESVRKQTSAAARAMFNKISGNRVSAFGLGVFVTAIIQSSTATGIMTIGLVSAGMLTAFQGVAIYLGAHLGTTSTLFLVVLSAFKIREFFMAFVFVGAVIKLITKDNKWLNIADLFIAFGVLFIGLMLMGNVFRHDVEIRTFFEQLFITIKSPFLLILLGLVFTVIIQSSTATTSIVLTMMIQGLVNIDTAMFIALGAHAGTSSTALLASIALNREAKRVAVVNCFFSVLGAIMVTAFLLPMKGTLLPWYKSTVPAVWHLPFFQVSYNFVLGSIKIWFIEPVLKLFSFIIKDKPEDEKTFGVTYLQDQLVDGNIDIALDTAKKEILVGADLVKDMFGKIDMAFKNKDMKLINEIRETDSKVDILHRAIILFLAKITQKETGAEETKRSINYLYIENELESIGDVIDKNLMVMAKKMIEYKLSFSEQGSNELAELHEKVMDNINRMVKALIEENAGLAKEIVKVYADVNERKYQLLHIERLHKGVKETIDTSSVHLDVINYYARINEHVVYIANRILWLTGQYV